MHKQTDIFSETYHKAVTYVRNFLTKKINIRTLHTITKVSFQLPVDKNNCQTYIETPLRLLPR